MQSNSLSSLEEISHYRSRNPGACLILDTNVLLLFLIGDFDQEYLKECSLMRENNKTYDKEHFELMKKILQRFLFKVVVTPHTISEMNMLSRNRIKPQERMYRYFTNLIQQLRNYEEHHVELKVLLMNTGIVNFGFTDISLVEISAARKWVILTDDFPLYRAFSEKIPVIYFPTIVANEIQLTI